MTSDPMEVIPQFLTEFDRWRFDVGDGLSGRRASACGMGGFAARGRG